MDKTIDAPAENLALYIEMMTDGDWVTEDTTPITPAGCHPMWDHPRATGLPLKIGLSSTKQRLAI